MKKSQEKGKVRVLWRKEEEEEEKEETSGRRRKLEASLFIHRKVGLLVKFPVYP